LLEQREQLSEILVLDQSERHEPAVQRALSSWAEQNFIRWIKLASPSIPSTMNKALVESRSDVVLFLDDDIIPEDNLIASHLSAHRKHEAAVVAGRVVQPWQEGLDFSQDETFHFASMYPRWINGFMGGNFSARRQVAISIGGFDENFVGVAYNFEDEFAYRLSRDGYSIYFEPKACIHHLKASGGGTRVAGDHLKTWRPDHSVGAYYCALRTKHGSSQVSTVLGRLFRAVSTRHHLQKPWWVPATLIAELLGLIWALVLAGKGPNYLSANSGQRSWW
jgi:glycosyltransferase involved in cell wall biosynthesis